MTSRGLAVWLVIGLPLASWPHAARAQTREELDHARQLYSQGLTQEAAGDWAGALATFQQVAGIKQTPQVRFHVARCKENLGRLNEALGGYRLAEYEAQQAADKNADVLEQIKSAREALEKRIPKLVIERGEGADAIKIELDGVVLGQRELGREINIDPGPHIVTGVLASGDKFTKKIYAKENDTKQVILDVPPELRAAAPGPRAKPEAATSPAEAPPDAGDHGAGPRGEAHASVLPWVIGGVGVASLAAAGVFYLRMKSAQKELDDNCIGNTCPDTLKSAQDRGKLDATVVDVTLGVGVVGIGVATVLLLGAGSSSQASARSKRGVSVDVAASSRGMGVDLAGRF